MASDPILQMLISTLKVIHLNSYKLYDTYKAIQLNTCRHLQHSQALTKHQMNHRQLNLHNIIKQQQSKISQLKQELSLVAKITQTSFLDSEKRSIQIAIQKDDCIVHLKTQLHALIDKYADYDQLVARSQQLQIQKAQIQGQCTKLAEQATQANRESANQQKRIRELQYKLQSKVQQYQKKTMLLQRQNKRLTSELQNLNQNFTLTQTQIDKLTKFYKSSTFDIPKRKQTLLWVDNLIKYMEMNSSSSQNKHAEVLESVKGRLGEMEREVMKAVSEVAVIQEGLVKEGERIVREMRQACEEMRGKEEEVHYGIDEVVKIGKREKQAAEKRQLQSIRGQMQQMAQQSSQTITQLKSRVKQLQTQKKTLVLGFQQIKTFLQNKQSSYKQQIASLKHTISQLLEGNQLREREFQDQIRLLSSQIQSISTRYYENIEYPVMRINEKVERELNGVKEELVKLSQQTSFRAELVELSERLKVYGEVTGEEEKEFQAIQLCMKKGNQLLITIRQLLAEINEKKNQRKSISRLLNSQHSANMTASKQQQSKQEQSKQQPYKQQPSKQQPSKQNHPKQQPPKPLTKQLPVRTSSIQRHTQMSFNESNVISCQLQYDASELQQLKQLQSVVSQIQLKQRQHKLTYEVGLLKKHNQKLTEHLTALERKFKQLAGNKMFEDKGMANYFATERKLVDLQAELQQAKELNADYERLLKDQLDKSVRKIDQVRKDIKASNKEETAILEALNQLNQRHGLIAQMMANRNSRIQQLQQSTKAINKMLIKPAQTFQALVKEFTCQLSSLTLIHNQHASRVGNQQWSSAGFQQSCRSRFSINQSTIKEYQEILAKRSEINNTGARYIVDLIRTIRETFPIRDNKRREDIGDKQNAAKNQVGVKSASKVVNFEKRVKELIANQQKHKQELALKIDKLLQTVTSLDTKRQKQLKLSSNKQKKIQQLLEKHLLSTTSQIKLMIQKQNREHSGLNTEALRDTASKLRQSIKENQGLKREIDVLLAVGKQQPLGRDNFYYEQV